MAIRTIVITDDDGEVDVATTECSALEALGLLKLAEYSLLEGITSPQENILAQDEYEAFLN